MKKLALLPIAFVIVLVFSAQGLSIPLSELDLGWFGERPLGPRWGPDPFMSKIRTAPEKGKSGSKEPFALTAVLLGGANPAAVLNGSIVHIGDVIQNHRVLKITKRSIFLKGPSGTSEVELKPLFSMEDQSP